MRAWRPFRPYRAEFSTALWAVTLWPRWVKLQRICASFLVCVHLYPIKKRFSKHLGLVYKKTVSKSIRRNHVICLCWHSQSVRNHWLPVNVFHAFECSFYLFKLASVGVFERNVVSSVHCKRVSSKVLVFVQATGINEPTKTARELGENPVGSNTFTQITLSFTFRYFLNFFFFFPEWWKTIFPNHWRFNFTLHEG